MTMNHTLGFYHSSWVVLVLKCTEKQSPPPKKKLGPELYTIELYSSCAQATLFSWFKFFYFQINLHDPVLSLLILCNMPAGSVKQNSFKKLGSLKNCNHSCLGDDPHTGFWPFKMYTLYNSFKKHLNKFHHKINDRFIKKPSIAFFVTRYVRSRPKKTYYV